MFRVRQLFTKCVRRTEKTALVARYIRIRYAYYIYTFFVLFEFTCNISIGMLFATKVKGGKKKN